MFKIEILKITDNGIPISFSLQVFPVLNLPGGTKTNHANQHDCQDFGSYTEMPNMNKRKLFADAAPDNSKHTFSTNLSHEEFSHVNK